MGSHTGFSTRFLRRTWGSDLGLEVMLDTRGFRASQEWAQALNLWVSQAHVDSWDDECGSSSQQEPGRHYRYGTGLQGTGSIRTGHKSRSGELESVGRPLDLSHTLAEREVQMHQIGWSGL